MHNNFLPLGGYQIKEEESTKESKSCQACQALELVGQPKSFYNMIGSLLHALFIIETPWIWSNSGLTDSTLFDNSNESKMSLTFLCIASNTLFYVIKKIESIVLPFTSKQLSLQAIGEFMTSSNHFVNIQPATKYTSFKSKQCNLIARS